MIGLAVYAMVIGVLAYVLYLVIRSGVRDGILLAAEKRAAHGSSGMRAPHE